MNTHSQRAALVTLLGAASAFAQNAATEAKLAAELQKPAQQSREKFSASYRAAFNVDVQFKNLGGFPPGAGVNPGPDTGFQANRTYDDGYNREDDNLNTYGSDHLTRNWGYVSGSGANNQILDVNGSPTTDPAAYYFVEMHASSSAAGASTARHGDEPLHGFEINYTREFQDHDTWRWGVEAAINYMTIGVSDNSRLFGDVDRVSDRFVVPLDEGTGQRFVPPAPYNGTSSAGPLLGSDIANAGTRHQTILGGAAIDGLRKFDADIFGFKVGPYVEFPFNETLSLNVSGGLLLAFVSSDVTYDETVTISGLAPLVKPRAVDSSSDLQAGGYVAANLAWALDENWSLNGGVQFQAAGTYRHREPVSGKTALLDLSGTFLVAAGLSYSF